MVTGFASALPILRELKTKKRGEACLGTRRWQPGFQPKTWIGRERSIRKNSGSRPVEQREGGLRYVCANGEFAIFISAGLPFGTHTQMGWEVEDIEATVRELRVRGVEFEEYDLPGLKTVDGIAAITGNYPSKGVGERGAWFRDSEGNLLGIGQPIRF